MVDKLTEAGTVAPLLYLLSALAGAAVAAVIGAWRSVTGLRAAFEEDLRRRWRPMLSARPGADPAADGVTVKNFGDGPAPSLRVHVAYGARAWRERQTTILGPGDEALVQLAPVRPNGIASEHWLVMHLRYEALGGDSYERRAVFSPGVQGAWHLIEIDERAVTQAAVFPAARLFGKLPGADLIIALPEEVGHET